MGLYTFAGYDSATHLSEETQQAEVNAPKGMVTACLLSGVTGFLYIIGLLYAMGEDIDGVANGASSYAIVNLFFKIARHNKNIVFVMVFNVAMNLFFSGVATMSVTSRSGYAMARDQAFPFSKYLLYVSETNKTPLTQISISFIIISILCLLPLINNKLFTAIITVSTVTLQVSYLIPIFLRITVSRNTFPVNPRYNLGPHFMWIGILSATWLFITSIIIMLPN
jgi:amino acid transporter